METSAPRDLTFYVCFAAFLGGLATVVVTGALMRNWVRDNDDELDPDAFAAVPLIGGVLLLVSSVVRYVQIRPVRALPLALACIAGATMTGVAAYVCRGSLRDRGMQWGLVGTRVRRAVDVRARIDTGGEHLPVRRSGGRGACRREAPARHALLTRGSQLPPRPQRNGM